MNYHVFDSMKTIKNSQMYVENELIHQNEVKEDEEEFFNINCVWNVLQLKWKDRHKIKLKK